MPKKEFYQSWPQYWEEIQKRCQGNEGKRLENVSFFQDSNRRDLPVTTERITAVRLPWLLSRFQAPNLPELSPLYLSSIKQFSDEHRKIGNFYVTPGKIPETRQGAPTRAPSPKPIKHFQIGREVDTRTPKYPAFSRVNYSRDIRVITDYNIPSSESLDKNITSSKSFEYNITSYKK